MIRIGIVLFGAASWVIVGLFVAIFPAADSLQYGVSDLSAGWIAVLLGLLAYFPWFRGAQKKAREETASLLGFLFSLIGQTVFAIVAAFAVHRDFLTIFFQSFCLHYILFLEMAPRLQSRFFFHFAERLYAFTQAIIVFFLVWIAMMGYAISVRSEPRWIPSIAYNIVNLGLCFFLYIANLKLHWKSRRELVITDTALLLETLDITPLITPSALPVARYLMRPGTSGKLSCKDAQVLLGADTGACDCTKAMLCPRYKNLYNRILELRRVVVALRLGTIQTPKNRRDILTEGWRFIPDESIAILELSSDSFAEERS